MYNYTSCICLLKLPPPLYFSTVPHHNLSLLVTSSLQLFKTGGWASDWAREERTVCAEQGRKKICLPFLNELQRAVSSEERVCTLLTLSCFLTIRLLTCTPAISHTQTHIKPLFPPFLIHPLWMGPSPFPRRWITLSAMRTPSLCDEPVELPSLSSRSAPLSGCVLDSLLSGGLPSLAPLCTAETARRCF